MAGLSEKEYEKLIIEAQDLICEDEPTDEDLKKAEKLIDQILADDPEDENGLCLKVTVLREQGRIDAAMNWVGRADKICDDNDFYTEKAMVLMDKAELLLNEAISACRQAIDCREAEQKLEDHDESDSLEYILAATSHMMLSMNEDEDERHRDEAEEILLEGLDSSEHVEFREEIKESLKDFDFPVLE